jgi:hypothetical protein
MSDCCCLLLGKDNLSAPSLNANGPAIKRAERDQIAQWAILARSRPAVQVVFRQLADGAVFAVMLQLFWLIRVSRYKVSKWLEICHGIGAK